MTLFDLNPRTLPEQVEVSLLNDKNGSLGLLFESPEPLDWNRIETGLSFTNKSDTVEEFDQKTKIVDASIKKVDADCNVQWVDILVLETTSLSGYKLEYLAASANETDPYQEFFAFSDNTYLAGTLLRICNGSDFGVPAEDVEHVQLFAEHSAQTFEPTGTLLRLKTAADEVIHTRSLYRPQVFNDLDTGFIRNADGTRFFVFVRNGSQPFVDLKDGLYRLQLTFQRDLGPEQSVLQRYGLSTDEETYLEFSLPALMSVKS